MRAARRRQRRKIGRNEKRLSCHFLQESIAEAYPTHSYMLERLYPRLRSFAITILLGVRSGKTGVTLSAGEPGHGCQFLSNVTTSGSAAVPLSKTYAFPQAFFRPFPKPMPFLRHFSGLDRIPWCGEPVAVKACEATQRAWS